MEFGLLAVPSVGCAIGGLGKMPGVYFRQQNADAQQMLLEAFYCAVDHALDLPESGTSEWNILEDWSRCFSVHVFFDFVFGCFW